MGGMVEVWKSGIHLGCGVCSVAAGGGMERGDREENDVSATDAASGHVENRVDSSSGRHPSISWRKKKCVPHRGGRRPSRPARRVAKRARKKKKNGKQMLTLDDIANEI